VDKWRQSVVSVLLLRLWQNDQRLVVRQSFSCELFIRLPCEVHGNMIDPITAVGLATSAYNAIKQGVAVGRELQDITGQLGKWGKAYSDFSFAEEQVKNPPWYSFKGSDTHSAIEIFAQKKKMSEMRKEIKNFISFQYGPSAWEEVLHIEAQMRKQRKEEVYRKAELKRALVEWTVGILVGLAGIAGLAIVGYFLGKQQGKW